jgi:hypothetical protein
MKKLFGILIVLLMFLTPSTALARGGHGGGHGGGHAHSSHSSHHSSKSSSKSSSNKSSSKSPNGIYDPSKNARKSDSNSTSQTKKGFNLFGNPKPKKIVSAAPVETWKTSIPRNNYIVPAESTFLYPTMTQRLLYMPHYTYYNSENLSNHKEDNSEYETVALFLVSVVVIGLFMFCAWLFLFN